MRKLHPDEESSPRYTANKVVRDVSSVLPFVR